MADYMAIAGVSRTLRTLLRDRMQGSVDVTLAPPDVRPDESDQRRINLYLFQVLENPNLKNQEIPGQGHAAAYGRPPLSLELMYLMTTHSLPETGVDADLDSQALLGDAMRALHDHAVVTDGLEITRSTVGSVGESILDSSLLNEFEKVRIGLEPIELDDLTKVWSALPNANFRRGSVYRVSVIQIESKTPRRSARPVETRRIHATSQRRPEIVEVYRTPTPAADVVGDPRINLTDGITIQGHNFSGNAVWIRLGVLEPIAVTPETFGRISMSVPNDALLQPGPLTVQVLVDREVEAVEGGLDNGVTVAHPQRFDSNLGLLQMMPRVTSLAPPQGDASTLLTVTGERLYREDLKSYVMVGDAAIEVKAPRPPGPGFAGDPWAGPSDSSVQVSLQSLARQLPGPPITGRDYPVRVQVNGVQNREVSFTFRLMP